MDPIKHPNLSHARGSVVTANADRSGGALGRSADSKGDEARSRNGKPEANFADRCLLSAADQSIKWTLEIGKRTLVEGMFKGEADALTKAAAVVDFLSSHDLHRAHGRHLHRHELAANGLKISELESDPALQDAVLTVHHAGMLTVGNHGTNKLIENQKGVTHAKILQMGVQMPIQMPIQIPLPQPAPQPQPASPTSPPQRLSPLAKRMQALLQKAAEFVGSKRPPA
jgi:hypothetical protein